MLRDKRHAYRESLRQEILDVARVLFAQEGYEATSVRKIADKVGCSPGILYHYFEDKEQLMASIVAETFQKMVERLDSQANDEAPIRDRLRWGLRAYVEFALDHPHHYQLLFRKPELAQGNQKIGAAFMVEGHRAFSCMQRLCDEAVEAGILRPDIHDKVELAQSLWVMIHGIASAQIGARGFPFIDRTRLIERSIQVLMTGILRPELA